MTAHLRKVDEPDRIELPLPYIVRWDVSPTDSIVQELGIKYFALEQQVPPPVASELIQLSPVPVDGFWLYRLR